MSIKRPTRVKGKTHLKYRKINYNANYYKKTAKWFLRKLDKDSIVASAPAAAKAR